MDIYVCVDVPSDNLVLWMNYLLHTWQIMNAHHSVCIEVTLEQSATWMIYYTRSKWTLSTTCACWCTSRLPYSGNDLLHMSEINAHFPLCALMYLQILLLHEWLITYITGKWTHCTMCALTYLQITLLQEWLITYFTNKCTLFVHVYASSDYFAVWKIYNTHCRYIASSLHADQCAGSMLYCTHNLDMDDPHHLCVGIHF